MIARSMKSANANEYPQNACGVFADVLNISYQSLSQIIINFSI